MCQIFEIADYNNISPEVCFKLAVWNLQKKFSLLSINYINEIENGNICKDEFKHLKMFRRQLLMLNRYDIRDIVSNTTNYNIHTYTEIKKILNSLVNN